MNLVLVTNAICIPYFMLQLTACLSKHHALQEDHFFYLVLNVDMQILLASHQNK